jgi:hypothetical protein
MIADLLADHVEPGAVGQIAAEILDAGLEATTDIAERIALYAVRFELPRADGQATLDHLLALAGPRYRVGGRGSAR